MAFLQGQHPQQARRRVANAAGPEEVYRLYRNDLLLLHSIPLGKTCDRPACLSKDSSLMSGTILFYKGICYRPAGGQLQVNGVARFGDPERIRTTLFGTLHSLDLLWKSHERLAASKPPHKRHPGGPYVYFTPHDLADTANARGGQPPEDYMDCGGDTLGPASCIRHRNFDFRDCCEAQEPPHLPPEAEAKGIEWNELRAALSYDNLVGLAYIHDPAHDPRQHLDAARDLVERVSAAAPPHNDNEPGGLLEMYVFKLYEANGVNGELLVQEEEEERDEQFQSGGGAADGGADGAAGAAGHKGGRAVTFEEYLAGLAAKP